MAGAGYKLFNTGDVLTAAQVNTYLQEQAVMRFANAAARTTALSGVLAEGMVSYLMDTDSIEVYNGTAWVGFTGDITEVQAGTGITVTSGTGPIPTVALTTPVTATNGGTAQTTYTTGDLLYASATNTLAKRAIGSTGQVLTVSGGVPTWAAASTGKIVQTVTATYSTNFTTTSTTYVDTGMSATITPTSASNSILVMHNGNYNQTSAASAVNIRLLRGSTNIKTYNAQFFTNNNLFRGSITLLKMDSPATTSATTYKIQISNDTAVTIGAQYNNEESTIILMEVAP